MITSLMRAAIRVVRKLTGTMIKIKIRKIKKGVKKKLLRYNLPSLNSHADVVEKGATSHHYSI